MTISNMVDFGTDIKASSIALSGALASIVIWATAAGILASQLLKVML